VKCIESAGGRGVGVGAGEIGDVCTAVLIICMDRVGGGGNISEDGGIADEIGMVTTLESLM
jgi:hypothetical protein